MTTEYRFGKSEKQWPTEDGYVDIAPAPEFADGAYAVKTWDNFNAYVEIFDTRANAVAHAEALVAWTYGDAWIDHPKGLLTDDLYLV